MFSRQTDISSTGWPSRPRSRPLLVLGELAVFLIAVVIPAGGGFYRANYYGRFVQGTCTITGGTVTSLYHSSHKFPGSSHDSVLHLFPLFFSQSSPTCTGYFAYPFQESRIMSSIEKMREITTSV